MQQLTEILTIKITPEIINYLEVISAKYKVKRSDFVRKAIIDKLKRDVPKMRTLNKNKPCPF